MPSLLERPQMPGIEHHPKRFELIYDTTNRLAKLQKPTHPIELGYVDVINSTASGTRVQLAILRPGAVCAKPEDLRDIAEKIGEVIFNGFFLNDGKWHGRFSLDENTETHLEVPVELIKVSPITPQ